MGLHPSFEMSPLQIKCFSSCLSSYLQQLKAVSPSWAGETQEGGGESACTDWQQVLLVC